MSTTKPAIPVTNLKERIAALEQKNASSGQRSTSPAPGTALAAGTALKDRIAKFEKKGAVPAPRGRFGLGAPPPPEARVNRNGELYGNRIPQPARFASGGSQPPSRSGSSIGFYGSAPDLDDIDKRRSFSLNSVISDLDDGPNYTPLTSPTFAFPPNSPESDYAPEASPTTSDVSHLKQPIKRAAPFSEILEAARKAAEKGTAPENINDAVAPTPFVGRVAAAQASAVSPEPTTTPLQSPVLTLEPDSIVEQAVPTIVEPVVVAPAIVIESPAPSPAAPTTPKAPLVQVEEIVTATTTSIQTPDRQPSPATSVASADSDKPKTRNNKDLTLDADKFTTPTETSLNTAAADENATPTSASHPNALSPLPSGTSSVFSGSSIGSGDSVRPFSMIDISLAERVTPATSRGNVVFLPPTTATLPRKSDLVYFPPTPTKEEPAPPAEVTTTPPKPTTFNAVVHEKVRETPDPIPHPNSLVPQTPTNRKSKPHDDNKRWKRMTMMAPPTPVTGELASLIQNAVILETMVQQGELPTEVKTREEQEAERRQREKERLAALAVERAKAAAEDAKRKAALEAEAARQREKAEQESKEEFTTNKLRHTFLIPLSKARSDHQLHRKEASMSEVDAQSDKSSRKSVKMPKTPEIPLSEIPEVPPVPRPSKSPSISSSKSRFSTFRRLGSVKSVIGRPSMDVSEDGQSMNNGSVDEFGQVNNGGHEKDGSWLSLSPKKSGGVGRASSFAGMFSRSRKSSGQALATAAAANTQSMYTLPPLPDQLSVIPPVPEYESTRAPRKSTSLKSLRGLKKAAPPPMDLPPLPSTTLNQPTVISPSTVAGSPASAVSSPGAPLKSPDYLGFGTMNIPASPEEARPMSWMSVSSLTSTLPSPLFEKDIFDAFPAVPAGTPAIPPQGGAAGVGGAGQASFDSAFLSSAIHLAGARGGVTPKSKPVGLPQ